MAVSIKQPTRCVFFAAVMLLSLITAQAAAQERTKIVFATTLATWEEMQAAINQFESENPGIDVDMQMIAGSVGPALNTMAVAGMMPDVFSFTHNLLESLVGNNLVTRLDSFFDRDSSVNRDKYFGLDMGIAGIWGLPLSTQSDFTVYNQSLFANMGLANINELLGPRSKNWTPEQFWNNALRLTLDTNGDGQFEQWGYSGHTTLRLPNEAETKLWPFGASLFDSQGAPTIDTPAMREALRFWSGIVQHGMTSLTRVDHRNKDFVAGKIGMGIEPRTQMASIAQTVSFNWALAPVPYKPDVPRATLGTGHYFGMSASCKNKDAAWKLMTWLTGPKGHEALASRALLPGNRDAFPTFLRWWKSVPADWNLPANLNLIWDTVTYSRGPSMVGSGISEEVLGPLLSTMMTNVVLKQEIGIDQGVTQMQKSLEALRPR